MAMRLIGLGLLWMGLLIGCSQDAVAQQLDYEDAFPNLTFAQPLDIQAAPDGSGRLFVVGKGGLIWVFPDDPDAASTTVFLDLSGRVIDDGEGGLLGLAFHPDFAQNGHLFVNYTALPTSGDGMATFVSRFTVAADDPDQVDVDSEVILLEVFQPARNHNAGQLQFGPDGYLYVGFGDGGGAGDPWDNGQDPTTLLGTLVRIDVDAPGAGTPYGIPPDNPFVGNTDGIPEEVYAYGFRNPWRFSFGPDGRFWVADVGQGAWEEIDLVEPGRNYGWDTMEGAHCFSPRSGCDRTGLTLPVWEYSHALGQSITGGYVYTGTACTALTGRYVYGDYRSGRIWALAVDEEGNADNRLVSESGRAITSFGLDTRGELLFADLFRGRVYRFTCSTSVAAETVPAPRVQVSAMHPNPTAGPAALEVSVAHTQPVRVGVYDVLGRERARLHDGIMAAGRSYTLTLDIRAWPSGRYVVRVEGDGFRASRALVVRR